MKNLIILLIIAGVIAVGFLFIIPRVSAEDNPLALKEHIKQLESRIAALENELQSKNISGGNSPATTQGGTWDPLLEMSRIQAGIDHMFQDSFWRGLGQPGFNSGGLVSPSVDIQETKDQYIYKMNLPGMEKADIQIETRGDQLVVSGEKKSTAQENNKNGQYYKQEASYGYFSNAIPLPQDADKEAISAKYQNGELVITLGRIESGKQTPESRKITIN